MTLARFLLALAAISVSAVVMVAVADPPASRQPEVLPFGNISAIRTGVRPLQLVENFGPNRFSLVFVVGVSCEACKDAAPIYKRILDTCPRGDGFAAHTLVVGSVSDFAAHPWLKGLGTSLRSFPTFNALEVSELPIAFGLDDRGRIVGVWPGPPSDSVVNQIGAHCR